MSSYADALRASWRAARSDWRGWLVPTLVLGLVQTLAVDVVNWEPSARGRLPWIEAAAWTFAVGWFVRRWGTPTAARPPRPDVPASTRSPYREGVPDAADRPAWRVPWHWLAPVVFVLVLPLAWRLASLAAIADWWGNPLMWFSASLMSEDVESRLLGMRVHFIWMQLVYAVLVGLLALALPLVVSAIIDREQPFRRRWWLSRSTRARLFVGALLAVYLFEWRKASWLFDPEGTAAREWVLFYGDRARRFWRPPWFGACIAVADVLRAVSVGLLAHAALADRSTKPTPTTGALARLAERVRPSSVLVAAVVSTVIAILLVISLTIFSR